MTKNCIIILNYNDSECTKKLVSQIEGYTSLDKVLVVDNCSTDDSYSRLLALRTAKVDVIQADKNGGYAFGNNFGAEYAIRNWKVETIFFANPDVSFGEDALIAVEKTLFLEEEYAVATALVGKGYNVWDLPGFGGTVRMLFMLCFTMHKHGIKKRLLETKGVHEVGVVEGSFFAIKASVFRKVGGFDERTFLYLEENILAYKLRQQGYKEVINANVLYLHEHSRSISREYKSKANAFKLFWPSFDIYLKYYLKCGIIKRIVFRLFYLAAYLERIVFDNFKRMGKCLKRKSA